MLKQAVEAGAGRAGLYPGIWRRQRPGCGQIDWQTGDNDDTAALSPAAWVVQRTRRLMRDWGWRCNLAAWQDAWQERVEQECPGEAVGLPGYSCVENGLLFPWRETSALDEANGPQVPVKQGVALPPSDGAAPPNG